MTNTDFKWTEYSEPMELYGEGCSVGAKVDVDALKESFSTVSLDDMRAIAAMIDEAGIDAAVMLVTNSEVFFSTASGVATEYLSYVEKLMNCIF